MTRLRDIIRREPSRGLSIPPWLDRLLSVGIVSTDPQVVRRQRCVNVAAYAGAVSGLSYIVLTSLYDLYGLLPLNAHNLMLIVAGLVLPLGHRLGEHFVAITYLVLISIGQIYVIFMLGILSDLHIFFTLAGAMLFFFGIENWKLFLGFFFYAAALLLFALNLAPVDGYLLPNDGRLRDIVSSHTLMSVVTINAALIFYALVLVNRDTLRPLTTGVINMLTSAFNIEWSLLMAASVMMSVPLIVAFALLQKHLTRGFGAGGVKG